MNVTGSINELGGIATREQLLARGFSGGDLTAAVRLGEIWRVRRAHYATTAANPDAVAAVRVGGRLAGLSAARSYGLWAGFDKRVHIALPANASRLRTQRPASESDFRTPDFSRREVVLHWIAGLSPHPECWRVSLAECLRQVVAWSDAETAIACLDTARTVAGLTGSDLDVMFTDATHEAKLRAGASKSGSDSGVESVVRQRLARIGIGVDQQVSFPGIGWVDMVVVGSRVVVEVDGEEYHSSPDQFENDRRRGAELAAIDYRSIRLSFRKVFGDWPWCVRMVRGAMSATATSTSTASFTSESPSPSPSATPTRSLPNSGDLKRPASNIA